MLRNDLKRIIGELAQEGTINFDLMICYKYIDEYCKKHKCNPTENTYEVVNGHLLINNEHIGIVEANPYRHTLFSCLSVPLTEEQWDYLEDELLHDSEI